MLRIIHELVLIFINISNLVGLDLEDAALTTPQLIKKYEYPVEIHHVITSDGYILELHRIPNPRNPPIILQHGILSSSSCFVLSGPGNALAYLVSDSGRDVWLTNSRGNTYSKNHTTLASDSSDFWQFDWEEMGTIDLPETIDYILNQTGFSQLDYCGHSQGTTISYVMLSEKPHYNQKIRKIISICPVAYLQHIQSPLLRYMSNFELPLEYLLMVFGHKEFLPGNEIIDILAQSFCKKLSPFCQNIYFFLDGFSWNKTDSNMVTLIIGHSPAGASTKQMLHFAQEIKSGEFRKYDYGIWENIIKYKSLVPPSYKLYNVKKEVYIFYSNFDSISTTEDVHKLCKELPSCRITKIEGFNHLDFLFSLEASSLVYRPIIHIVNN